MLNNFNFHIYTHFISGINYSCTTAHLQPKKQFQQQIKVKPIICLCRCSNTQNLWGAQIIELSHWKNWKFFTTMKCIRNMWHAFT